MGGVAGFWGGVFSMGSIYLMMVAAKSVQSGREGKEGGLDLTLLYHKMFH